jgi:ATP-binding cassette subfamily F protein uup
MALLSLRNVSLGFGDPPLIVDANATINNGERVCLIGRNGTGKTSLLRMINNEFSPDSGNIEFQQGVTAALVPQHLPEEISEQDTIYDIVAEGVGELGSLIRSYHNISAELARNPEDHDKLLKKMQSLQTQLEAKQAWDVYNRIETVISKLQLDADATLATLSGGQQRRVLIGRAMVSDPDVLMLDEPTNHLDISSIEWLEQYLKGFNGALLFISHDRAFVRSMATRILEMDRGELISWDCDYDSYLERKEQALEIEEQHRKEFDKKLAQEEEWLRRGMKARRKRNMGRVRKLEEMRDRERQRRERMGTANMNAQEADRSGKQVIKVHNLGFSYDDQPLVQDFEIDIHRGEKIGIVGPNGVGKTTLIQLLLQNLEPDTGTVKHGTNLEVAYFDQHRAQLDDEMPVYQAVADGKSHVVINGKKKHVISYLQDFLFSKQRAKGPVKLLSGGERNRLFLAKLFTKPSNVLVLDEPTNDLDIETLELLEQVLSDYEGTILMVSHDRAFLDNVVTGILAFEEPGKVKYYIGGYEDWVRQRKVDPAESFNTLSKSSANNRKSDDSGSDKSKSKGATESEESVRKLSYNEKKELNRLPERIEKLESEQQELFAQLSDPSFYQQEDSEEETIEVQARLDEIESELEQAYNRWTELEAIAEQA